MSLKPVPRWYRLTPAAPPVLPPCDVEVTPDAMRTPGPIGMPIVWPWDVDAFHLGGYIVECSGEGTYRMIGPAGEVSGTCVPIPPPVPPPWP